MDQQAFHDRAYLRLLARCLWQPGLQRRLDLSDLVQKTLAIVQEKQEQYRGSTPEERRGWLRAILRNELARAARDNQAGEVSVHESSQRFEEALIADETSPSQKAINHENLSRLALALEQLSEEERTVIELKYLHGCSVLFISETIGRTQEAVAGLLKRGKHRLRGLLEERP